MNEMSKGKKEKLIKKLKKKPGVDNPWALANWIEKKQGKNMKKENMGSTCQPMYAVIKPIHGMDQDQMVKQFDPLQGISGLNLNQSDVLSAVPDETEAQRIAAEAYNSFQKDAHALEEKKHRVVDAIKKKIDEMEKLRKENVDMIKENPGNVTEYKHKVAELATKIDELVTTLERVEKSKKQLDKKEDKHDKKHNKKKVEEALRKALTSK